MFYSLHNCKLFSTIYPHASPPPVRLRLLSTSPICWYPDALPFHSHPHPSSSINISLSCFLFHTYTLLSFTLEHLFLSPSIHPLLFLFCRYSIIPLVCFSFTLTNSLLSPPPLSSTSYTLTTPTPKTTSPHYFHSLTTPTFSFTPSQLSFHSHPNPSLPSTLDKKKKKTWDSEWLFVFPRGTQFVISVATPGCVERASGVRKVYGRALILLSWHTQSAEGYVSNPVCLFKG